MLNELKEILVSHTDTTDKISTIKLKVLLQFHREKFGLRSSNVLFPPVEIGSITLVDQVVLLSLIDITGARNILEIGTYLGYTTRMLVENTDSASIYSVDLPNQQKGTSEHFEYKRVLLDGDYNDDYLRTVQNQEGEVYLEGLSNDDRSRITLIKRDSTTMDYKKEVGELDFAFIDGGHDIGTVAKDTALVLEAMPRGIIVWHDFSSDIHSGVTEYLSKEIKSRYKCVYHVQGSLCAFILVGV
ncbi:class I SAM-dependent methyltransferase [Ketobacter sp.]